jgi:hypothetical protein
MIFNNATSLPLLLLQALGKIGTLKSLVGEGEEMSEVLRRGKVRFYSLYLWLVLRANDRDMNRSIF